MLKTKKRKAGITKGEQKLKETEKNISRNKTEKEDKEVNKKARNGQRRLREENIRKNDIKYDMNFRF